MKKTKNNPSIRRLNRTLLAAAKNFRPPENLTVSEWADRYRRLSPENSAEAGAWRTSRTPYLKKIMDSFTDPRIRNIAIVASSQVGKTELLLNILGYIIDIDPGGVMFIVPTMTFAEDFSKRRVSSMIKDCKRLSDKMIGAKVRDSSSTITKKKFPGGMLTLTGSNSPVDLSGTPSRYILADERDRWAASAGSEGDPWGLAEARTATFYNAKLVEVSTPTVKGFSAIEKSFNKGTRERWNYQCPECGEYSPILFDYIKFEFDTIKHGREVDYRVTSVQWACPGCGCLISEETIKKQPAKWVAENPVGFENGFRSFWLNGFSSPWMAWETIILKFLRARKDPEALQVVYNTLFGELWEDRGDVETEDALMARREEYGAELPDGVLVLTCAVDTQDDRLEYEILGHGHYGETWGIKKGVIWGKPDTFQVWEELDSIIDKVYYFKGKQRGLNISMTFVDSGGHYAQEVYEQCRIREPKRVFAIKGGSREGKPFVSPPKKTNITLKGKYIGKCWLFMINVDAGKAKIKTALKVQEPGPKYCHFPVEEERGYNEAYFSGLLSEREVVKRKAGRNVKEWQVIKGHERNEPLDLRNYNLAAFAYLSPDLDAVEQRIKNKPVASTPASQMQPKRRKKRYDRDEW